MNTALPDKDVPRAINALLAGRLDAVLRDAEHDAWGMALVTDTAPEVCLRFQRVPSGEGRCRFVIRPIWRLQSHARLEFDTSTRYPVRPRTLTTLGLLRSAIWEPPDGLTVQVPLYKPGRALISLIDVDKRFDREITPFAASEIRGVVPVRLCANTHYGEMLGLRL